MPGVPAADPPTAREGGENPLWCSSYARAEGIDPIGTAGCYRGLLLVEVPLPWPRDVVELPELAPLAPALAAGGVRLQGLVTDRQAALRRVVAYRWPAGPAAGYVASELAVAPGELVGAALALLEGRGGEPVASGRTDVLVCTHGRRDRCCGAYGAALALELAAEPGRLGDGAHLWRTSHTGGHRFAPTALVLPEGTAWASLDAGLLARIVRRSGDVGEVLAHYRGCTGLATPGVQALEREVLRELGWAGLDLERSGRDLGDGSVELTVARAGGPVTYGAVVRVARELPVPECGAPLAESKKTEPELAVSSLRRLAG